jgi:hypothetical protein
VIRFNFLSVGPTFTEELLALPLSDYLSSMSVKPNANGGSTVTWTGTVRRKNPRDNLPEGESDAGVLKFIAGAYQGGLQNLKKVLEAK